MGCGRGKVKQSRAKGYGGTETVSGLCDRKNLWKTYKKDAPVLQKTYYITAMCFPRIDSHEEKKFCKVTPK